MSVSKRTSKSIEYNVAPFAIAVAHYVLYGRVLSYEDTTKATENLDQLGYFWLIEAVSHHPSFEPALNLVDEQKKEEGFDITQSVQAFTSLFLGSIGGVVGLTAATEAFEDTAFERLSEENQNLGGSFGPQFVVGTVEGSPNLKFSYKSEDGVCPGCGKVHTGSEEEVNDLLATLKEKFGVDAKVTTVEAKVDDEGNITNLEDIPEAIRDTLAAKVKTLHAELKAKRPTIN